MICPSGRLRIAALLIGLLAAGPATASFEIESKTAAERAAATGMALGLLKGSFHIPRLVHSDSLGGSGIALEGFRPFGMGEIRHEALWAAIRLGCSGHGMRFSYQRFGALSYLEETYLIGCTLRAGNLWLQPDVRLGFVSFDERRIDYTTLFDLAVVVRLRSGINVSVTAENPSGSGLHWDGTPCPVRLKIGVGHLVSTRLAWGVGVTKEAGQATCVAAGVEGNVAKGVMLRSGLRSCPREFCLGLGLRIKGVFIDISTSVMLDLGPTHAAGVTYMWQ